MTKFAVFAYLGDGENEFVENDTKQFQFLIEKKYDFNSFVVQEINEGLHVLKLPKDISDYLAEFIAHGLGASLGYIPDEDCSAFIFEY